jgi:hypothetical protein
MGSSSPDASVSRATLVGVVASLLIASAVATSFLFAAAIRSPSMVTTLLAAYLAFVANLVLTGLVLSPIHQVTRGGLALAEVVLLAAAFATWWARGRPRLPLGPARAALREVVSSPVTAVFLVFVLGLLAYELVLGLTVPVNNGDALAYHLAKAAAWAQHGGYYWIPDAPTVRINAFQPLAEQQLLFLFVATGNGALNAIPQFLAELAILVAVYGASRRLGFGVRPAASGAFLLATFSLIALEAPTAQNDLVAASFPVVAACLLLGRGRLEPALAGAAAAFGLGAKLSTGLVLPILVWLAIARGRRTFGWGVVGGLVGFVAIGMWGYVLNAVHSGEILGADTATVENRASPAYPRSVANAFDLMYGMMDASVLSSRLIHALAIAGIVIGLAVGVLVFTRRGLRRGIEEGAGVAVPFLAPLLVIGGAGVIAFIADVWGFPIRGSGGIAEFLEANLNQEYGRIANEDYSAFGPVGIVALLLAVALTVWAFVRGRVDQRHLAFAAALPFFLVVISLVTAWNAFLIRFFAVPAVLAAPLLARLFRGQLTTAAYFAVAAIAIVLTLDKVHTKPFTSPYGFGHPWQVTQVESLRANSRNEVADGYEALQRVVPEDACLGAVLDVWEPSYLLYGPDLKRRVVYLPPGDALATAYRKGLFRVIVTTGDHASVIDAFSGSGWKVQSLGGFWMLATEPGVEGRGCA